MAERSSKRASSAPVMRTEDSITDSPDAVNKVDHSPGEIPECAVCLQSCIHPVKLPCSHIFCFLCVKGAANQSRRCALCRQPIPVEFFNNPTLIGKNEEYAKGKDPDTATEHYSWFYEGRNGWWQYDERTDVELEESYNAKKRTFELLIAGYMYVIDLDNMVQMRRNDPSRRRRIKRDLVSAPKKGIAGLKIAVQPESVAATGDQQAAEVESEEAAACGVPSIQSGTSLKAVSVDGAARTRSRTAGVGRDHANVNPSNVPLDQYDADDDYDGTDDEAGNEQWVGSRRGPVPRLRPERHANRSTRDTHIDPGAAQNLPHSRRPIATSSTRSNPQGLPIRHQRVNSAPETSPGQPDQVAVTSSRRAPQDNSGIDQQERVDPASVGSAMRSLNLSTPDDSLYEVTAAPVQPPHGLVRQRRRRQRQSDDVEL